MEIKRTGLWIGRQAARMCLMVLLVSILAFGLLAASPIDPLQTNVGQTALGSMSPEQIARLRSYWGTDLPPVERYLNWLKDFLHGNMGTSLLYRRPVAEVIGEKVLSSVWLLFTAWLLSGILGFFLGVLAGKKRGGVMDRIVTGYSLFVASTPSFWVAMVLLMVFAVKLHWFPIGFSVPIGMDAGAISIADRIRQETVSEEMRVLYVAMTRPKDRLVMTYAVPNANGPKAIDVLAGLSAQNIGSL